jgi:hypothetical protein
MMFRYISDPDNIKTLLFIVKVSNNVYGILTIPNLYQTLRKRFVVVLVENMPNKEWMHSTVGLVIAGELCIYLTISYN